MSLSDDQYQSPFALNEPIDFLFVYSFIFQLKRISSAFIDAIKVYKSDLSNLARKGYPNQLFLLFWFVVFTEPGGLTRTNLMPCFCASGLAGIWGPTSESLAWMWPEETLRDIERFEKIWILTESKLFNIGTSMELRELCIDMNSVA